MAFDPAAIADAKEKLLRFPGVHMVGLGLRWTNGQLTDKEALVVYVRRKLPSDRISPGDLIPAEVNGIPTDVLEADPMVRLAGNAVQPSLEELPLFDDEEYDEIRGGLGGEGPGGAIGTIGCIARATDTANNGKIVVLSNQHVFAACSGDGVGGSAYQPRSSCCCCGRVAGKVLRSRSTTTGLYYRTQPSTPSIDASIALLLPGTKCLAEIQIDKKPGVTTQLVTAVRPTAQITNGLLVQKRGSRTGSTTGKVVNRDADSPKPTFDKSDGYRHQILINPDYPAGATGIVRFAAGGDSGSVVMTQAGDAIVALLWGGISTRPNANANLTVVQGLATDINAVMSAMQIDIATTNTAGQIITVPATNVLAAPAPASPPAPVPAHARRILDAARRDIEATEHGRVYAEVFRRNHEEVWGLVRDNRRVGAIWKRHGGQAILQAVLDAVDRPDKPIPATVKSRPLSECAARIASILRRFGSAALGRDLDRYEQLVGALPGSSYMQHLARLRAGEAIGG